MSNEREEFEKWADEGDNWAYIDDRGDALHIWQACAERYQREIAALRDLYNEAEKERDALASQLERMREALEGAYSLAIGHMAAYQFNHSLDDPHPQHAKIVSSAKEALSLTAADALRERDARKAAEVLREAAIIAKGSKALPMGNRLIAWEWLNELAAAKERGE